MRFSPRTWSLLSVMLFIAAAFFWMKGNEYEARKRQGQPGPAAPSTPNISAAVELLAPRAAGVTLAQLGSTVTSSPDELYPLRLRNTARTLNDLIRDDRAVLLANALIDTAGEPLDIPEHLRAGAEPGSYIVQWSDAVTPEFRALLANHNARIVSYVPNNAYLVQAGAADADGLRAAAGVQAVLPFEPYYKLEQSLLEVAVEHGPIPEDLLLRVTLVPGSDETALREIAALGAVTLAREESPFGPQLIVQPTPYCLPDLARLGSVQGIEPDLSRKLASDLTRLVLGVSGNSTNSSNYLNLSGSNIWVNINDTGIDPNNPGLSATTFVTPAPPVRTNILNSDPEGHGTFVAGLIVGSGAQGPKGTNAPSGSDTNASLRGLAPRAQVIAQPIDPAGEELYPKVTDTWLIQNAAATNYQTLRRTNTLISNNSWTYPTAAYDSAAARYDAAVRDAIPGSSGSQPLLFVFAAGNTGFGDDSGAGGQIGRVESPGSAKNVITVGALESRRLIELGYTNTNTFYFTNIDGTIETNTEEIVTFPFIAETDSSNQVAWYSARGNVGVGIEGTFGRFKPDVVAPGTMLLSLKSSGYNITNALRDLSPTNELAMAFRTLNTNLGPYRYDSGTTFAAANISGLMALIQEYFERLAPTGQRGTLSPALMKALLVNGSRSLTEFYDLAVRAAANFQGWGLPHLPSSLTSFSTNSHAGLPAEKWRLRFVEQSAANALATGQSRTWRVKLSTNASVYPLRATLVWTDPPGNPAVGVKLVNDLDLIVTNVETKTVFHGNNFFPGSDFTEATPTNVTAQSDSVNNVENVFIRNPKQFGQEFTITVRARRVNVNAVPDYLAQTGNANDVVQDFALVLSSDIGSDPSVIVVDPDTGEQSDLTESEVFPTFEEPSNATLEGTGRLSILTNGLPLLNERVGANPTLLGTNGVNAQWNFYVFTNATISNAFVFVEAGTNVAFVTFNPPNLSTPRNEEADIDVYVSTDRRLLDLEPSVVSAALKSTGRGGTETVVLSNGVINQVYYIGVKSEDQQAAEFSLMGVSRNGPFEEDRNGQSVLTAVPITSTVLDGSANRPSAATLVAIGVSNRRAARVQTETMLSHENIGDLVGVLAHTGVRSVLNNHTLTDMDNRFSGTNLLLRYNDSGEPDANLPRSRPSDGPGTLNDFAGTRIVGSWIFEMIDNAPGHTGRVEAFTIFIDPLQPSLLSGQFIDATNRPNQTLYFPVDVPAGVTNLTFELSRVTPGPLDVMLREGSLPTTNQYDFRTNIVAPGGVFEFPTTNSEPLFPGTYFLAVRNPLPVNNSYRLMVTFGFDNGQTNRFNFSSGNIPVRDDSVTSQTIPVFDDKLVASVQVGVNMKHPRSADMMLHLVSPQGTRVLLAENRGYTNALGFGTTLTSNGIPLTTYHTIFTDDTNLATLPLKFVDLGRVADLAGVGVFPLSTGFEQARDTNYSAGQFVAGWRVDGGLASILSSANIAHSGSNLLSLGARGTRISTNVATVSNASYRIHLAVRSAAAPASGLFSTGVDDGGNPLPLGAIDPHYALIESADRVNDGPEAFVIAARPFWNLNSSNSQWIANSTNTLAKPDGVYRYRTYVSMHEQNTALATLSFKWAAVDDLSADVFLNGQRQTVLPASPSGFNAAPFGTIAGFTSGLNILDFVVSDPVSALRVQVNPTNAFRFVRNANPTMTVSFGGTTRTIAATTNWTVVVVDALATNASTLLSLAAESGEVWVDSVRVERSGDVFVLPEEPLSLLIGERAIGDWTLEARDARTGAVLPATEVLAWRLDLNFAQAPIVSERLFAGSNFPLTPRQINSTNRMRGGVLFTNQTHYFMILPCPGARQITVTLNGINNFDAIEMLADHSGIPTGDPETDDFVTMRNNENPGSPGGRITFQLTDREPAPARMIPGKPFFLAVRNRLINTTNVYTLRVDSDVVCMPPPPPVLQANQPVSSFLTASSAGEASEGDTFEASVASGAAEVAFTVAADGATRIVAQRGSVPTRESHTHSGTGELRLSGSAENSIAGTWFVRVLNDSPEPVSYTITATGDLGEANETGPMEVQVLIDGNEIRLEWNSEPGAAYRVESSIDLQTWVSAGTVTAEGAQANFTEPFTTGVGRFYRVTRQ